MLTHLHRDDRCLVTLSEYLEQQIANRLTRRFSESRTVLIPSFQGMRTSILARAVTDLVSR
jgi:hypothetical protein